MFFVPIIARWGANEMAADLGLPVKNVRRWIDNDSIPAEWFSEIERCAAKREVGGVTARDLADAAEARRRSKASELPHQGKAA